ncbi:MAG TPA: prepilin-type N-terminal cleavage/methylation domain-containing protein [Dictyoglomaceae bacterium]|nr:prepilin-type N-terminal cleavage/methylation domain-containing protein [Dictyoglomaceae bacterium]HOL38793.1 prepilin-type N-terminal cleavage/methylation domain-containing protein [Dictyoglomaceae bacterium]HOP94504.1 prepilin-type N-terminal cleavage/methylation domain-containing protein [Dictyoglomaceae bacterium]HPP15459.1 prepilin-type N-terminal cleavage/methylation domain-containing protein [Dictyoglomaceae bacterium]HPU43237.1 prepilin-type N-terminal cleavage/methylation domain-con
MRDREGFTLIELLIVCSIISFLLYMSVSWGISYIQSWKLTRSALTILRKISELRDTSFSYGENTPDMIYFYPAIDLVVWKTFNSDKNKYEVKESYSFLEEKIDLVSATFGDNNYIYFTRIGTPSSGGTIALGIKNLRKYIIITPATGRVYLSDKMPEY